MNDLESSWWNLGLNKKEQPFIYMWIAVATNYETFQSEKAEVKEGQYNRRSNLTQKLVKKGVIREYHYTTTTNGVFRKFYSLPHLNKLNSSITSVKKKN